MKTLLKKLARKAGYEVMNLNRPAATGLFPPDFDEEAIATYAFVRPYTQTTPERVFVLLKAVDYVLKSKIPGAFVECGVWKGGSMMAMARALKRAGRSDVDLFLFDTFEGMPRPVEQDGSDVLAEWEKAQGPSHNMWNYASLDEVKANLGRVGYPNNRIHYVQGRVENSIPSAAPDSIALLRLDTDFYESTKHELLHLFPRLSRGGIIIIDDYGAFRGARQAVDEYLSETGTTLWLSRIDADARVGVKA